MSDADTKTKTEDAEAPALRKASLTVDMLYDPRGKEEDRAAKLIAAMMDAFTKAVGALELSGCGTSGALASVLLTNMAHNGHEGCACRVALDYVASVGHTVEIEQVGGDSAAAIAARRKAMH